MWLLVIMFILFVLMTIIMTAPTTEQLAKMYEAKYPFAYPFEKAGNADWTLVQYLMTNKLIGKAVCQEDHIIRFDRADDRAQFAQWVALTT